MPTDDPSELLVEHRIERPQQDPYDRRVRADGLYEERTSVKVTIDPATGAPRFEHQPLVWRPLWRLGPEALADLHELLRRSNLAAVDGEHWPKGNAIGGSDVTWSVRVDGARHTVVLHGAPAVKVPEVDAFERALELLLTRAADEARARGELYRPGAGSTPRANRV